MKNYNENEIKYVVWRGTGDATGKNPHEIDQDYYDTLSAANDAARAAWNHLTQRERRSNYICTGWVAPADICDDLTDEDRPWWEACDDIRTNDDCFDSLKHEAAEAAEEDNDE